MSSSFALFRLSSQQASLVLDSFLPGEDTIVCRIILNRFIIPSTMRFSIVTLVVAAAAAVSQAAVIPRANTVLERLEARYYAEQLFPRVFDAPMVVEPREYTSYLLTRRAHPRDFYRR